METKNLTCINCPIGCQLKVFLDGETLIKIEGNTCKRGEIYAKNEITAPLRVVTTTVRVTGGSCNMVSVKTEGAIPKGKIFEAMKAINEVKVKAPVNIGDVIIKNLLGLNIDVLATSNVK